MIGECEECGTRFNRDVDYRGWPIDKDASRRRFCSMHCAGHGVRWAQLWAGEEYVGTPMERWLQRSTERAHKLGVLLGPKAAAEVLAVLPDVHGKLCEDFPALTGLARERLVDGLRGIR